VTIQDDPFISEILAGHVPERREIAPDWANVLRRAGVREHWQRKFSRRRLVIVFATILVAMIASALALSAEKNWWFLRDGMSPSPSGDVVVAATGTWDDYDWSLVAFRSSDLHPGRDELCFTLNLGRSPSSQGGSMGCGPIPESSSGNPDKISFVWAGDSEGSPRHAYGPVVGEATQVRIELAGGNTIETKTIPAPAALGLPVRFFATTLPGCAEIERIVALDNEGNIVAQNTVPPRFHTPQGC
jgi:hypothetical protein